MIQELFPFLTYFLQAQKIRRQVWSLDDISKPDNGKLARTARRYNNIERDEISARLRDEHDRAKKIDEKTFRFTLLISVGLSIFGSAFAFIASEVASTNWAKTILVIISIAEVFFLVGGLIALAAIRTMPFYGIGTEALLAKKNDAATDMPVLSRWLVQQEQMNVIRQMRNEASYQCMRNGLILTISAMIMIGITYEQQPFTS